MKRLPLILALLLAGCASVNPVKVRQAVTLSKNLQHAATLWRAEANRHGVDPVVLVCHGGTQNGKWVMQPDEGPAIPVEGAVRILRQVYGDRPLLLVVCNPDHLPLKVPGCYYGKQSVWSVPDRYAFFRFGCGPCIGRFEELTYSGKQ